MKQITSFLIVVVIFLFSAVQVNAQNNTKTVTPGQVKIETQKKAEPQKKTEPQKKEYKTTSIQSSNKAKPSTGTAKKEKGEMHSSKKGGSLSGSAKNSKGNSTNVHHNKSVPQNKKVDQKPSKGSSSLPTTGAHSTKPEQNKNNVKTLPPESKPATSLETKRVEQAQKTVKSAKGRIQQAQAKIDYARKLTREAYEEKKISEKEYKEKMAKLDEYEKQMLKLKKENAKTAHELQHKIDTKEAQLEDDYKKGKISKEEYDMRKTELEKLKANSGSNLQKNPNKVPSSGKVTKRPE